MPLPDRFDFGHLYGEKICSSFGLASFSSPATFIKSTENRIKVVSRHFKRTYLFLCTCPTHSISLHHLSHRWVASWHSWMASCADRVCVCYFSLVKVCWRCCCCPTTFFASISHVSRHFFFQPYLHITFTLYKLSSTSTNSRTHLLSS